MREAEMQGWVLYDDACGFCRRWVPFLESTLKKRGFAIAPLQRDWVAEELQLSEEELIHDLRLLLPDGENLAGADVYRYVMRRIWWAYPLYVLSILPLFNRVFDGCYRLFATYRYKVSKACRLPGA